MVEVKGLPRVHGMAAGRAGRAIFQRWQRCLSGPLVLAAVGMHA